jgi:hypothetical protein
MAKPIASGRVAPRQPMTERPRIFYGLCEDGPWSRKHLAHHEPSLPVWIDPDTNKAVAGQVGPSKAYPHIRRGFYRFNEEFGNWAWEKSSQPK